MNKRFRKPKKTCIYDAELTRIDTDAGILDFVAGGQVHTVKSSTSSWWTLGAVGRLTLGSNSVPFSFYAYPEQGLRRDPASDDPIDRRWGWRLGDHRLTAKAGVIPGQNGDVRREDTKPIRLDIPREFLELCAAHKLTPATVLRGYIADLCELQNWVRCPREDEYCSNGSDERSMAQAHFYRAYGWVKCP